MRRLWPQWQEGKNILGKGDGRNKGWNKWWASVRKQFHWGCWRMKCDEANGWVHAAGMGCPLSFSSLTPNCWSQALGAWLGNFAVIYHSMAFMTTLWSQMRGTIYHKGLFFMSYWAPGNSCMLFIPHTLFSSLFMKFPMSLTSASRRQAVLWIKCCLTKAQQLGMSLRVCIRNSNSILCFSTYFISE